MEENLKKEPRVREPLGGTKGLRTFRGNQGLVNLQREPRVGEPSEGTKDWRTFRANPGNEGWGGDFLCLDLDLLNKNKAHSMEIPFQCRLRDNIL